MRNRSDIDERVGEERYKSRSPLYLAFRKFLRHPLAKWGGITLLVLYICIVFAESIAPYSFRLQTKRKAYMPPVKVRFFDEDGMFHARPFIYNSVRKTEEITYRKYYVEKTTDRQGKEKRYPIKLFAKGERYKFLWLIPTRRHLLGIELSEEEFKDDNRPMISLLGTDQYGRDVLSRLIFGGRVSLTIGLVGFGITFVLGLFFGGISGYFGGWVDVAIQRFIEMLMLFPFFYLLLTLRAAIPGHIPSWKVYLYITLIMSFIGWAGLARVIRGMVLSISQREYVLAARAQGVTTLSIIWRHILPNTFSYSIVAATVSIPLYMVAESALSFLNLGIQEPYASWGNMLSSAQAVTEIKFHPWMLLPGVLIFISVVAFQFLGDGLRDAFDPKTVISPKKREFESLMKKEQRDKELMKSRIDERVEGVR